MLYASESATAGDGQAIAWALMEFNTYLESQATGSPWNRVVVRTETYMGDVVQMAAGRVGTARARMRGAARSFYQAMEAVGLDISPKRVAIPLSATDARELHMGLLAEGVQLKLEATDRGICLHAIAGTKRPTAIMATRWRTWGKPACAGQRP